MGSHAVSPLLRSYRRRRAPLDLDLNRAPVENPDQEGTSSQATSQPVNSIATIDVEAIDDDDDDVVFSSSSAFAEAKNNSERNHGRATIVDVDSAEEMTHGQKRRRVLANQPLIDVDHFINLESNRNSTKVAVEKPTPPKEPTFSCPICMGPLVEETSTKCGHIFCKACIKTAIATQAKCPTCRKRVTVKELIRVFLPTTN